MKNHFSLNISFFSVLSSNWNRRGWNCAHGQVPKRHPRFDIWVLLLCEKRDLHILLFRLNTIYTSLILLLFSRFHHDWKWIQVSQRDVWLMVFCLSRFLSFTQAWLWKAKKLLKANHSVMKDSLSFVIWKLILYGNENRNQKLNLSRAGAEIPF